MPSLTIAVIALVLVIAAIVAVALRPGADLTQPGGRREGD